MEKLRKTLALVMVFTMMVSTVAFAAVPDDVKGTDYEEAASVLGVLSIMNGDDGGFRPNDTITRAEFAAVVARALDLEDAAKVSGGSTEYTDVPATHWAAGYINLASDMGIINGYGNGNFGPEDTVKYEQALTMIVRALGYEPAAKQKGGYPVGYLFIASNEGITDDIDAVSGTPALRGDVAQMVYNSLTVDMMEQDEYGDEATFKKAVGKNLLTEYLDVDKVLGVVSATYWADFGRNLGENEVAIKIKEVNEEEVTEKTETYEISDNVNADKLLGYEVELFVTDDDEIITISATDSNTLLDIKNEGATRDDEGYMTNQTELIENTDDGDVESYTFNYFDPDDDEWDDVKIDKDALFIINGEDVEAKYMVHRSDKDDNLEEDPGFKEKYAYATLTNYSWNMSFKLVNNDEDGDYDLIYQICGAPSVVDFYDEENDELVMLRESDLSYEFDDDDKVEVISMMAFASKGEADLTLEDLKHGDVVVAIMAPSEDQFVFIVSPFKEEGVIEEVSERTTYEKTRVLYKGMELLVNAAVTKTYVTVNGVEMECGLYTNGGIVSNVVDMTDGKDKMTYDFNVGDEGIFYKDLERKLVAIDLSESSNSSNYGYLLDSEASDEDFESGRKFKILTATGDEVIYEADDEVEIDGDEVEADKIFDLSEIIDGDIPDDGVFLGQGYIDVNDNDVYDPADDETIGMLMQYELNSNGEITEVYTEDSSEFNYEDYMLGASFNEDTKKIGIEDADGDFIESELLDSDTLVFFISTADEDDNDVYGVEDISEDDEFEVVDFYYEDAGKPDVIVIYSAEFSGASTDYEIAVVDRITSARNDSDDKVDKLYGYIKGEEVAQLAEDGLNIKADEGDIIYVTYNSDGEIDGVEEYKFNYKGDAVAYAVYDKDSESITIWEDGDEESYTFADTYYVYKIDESADEFTVESYSDIKTKDKNRDNYSQVALGFNDDDQVEVVVIYSE